MQKHWVAGDGTKRMQTTDHIAWDHRIAWDRRIDKRHNLNSTLAFSHTHKCHNDIVNEKQSITLHDIHRSIRTDNSV